MLSGSKSTMMDITTSKMLASRASFPEGMVPINPTAELNAGLWTLFAGATAMLAARLWAKLDRSHGLWWDDYILLISWMVVLVNDIIISVEFATGYVDTGEWDDRMHILINISSCGTLVGQALSKTAFAVTLLRMTERWQVWVLWFIIISMNGYMTTKVLFQWGRLCDDSDYDLWYRPDYCVPSDFLDKFKEGGNVYNILMDFVLALFPWAITWKLKMRRYEKMALAATMSLGMLVAIVSAVRTWWVGQPIYAAKDELYFWRRAMSNIWFSSEVTGTIIVQCIPILRPFLREVHAAISSRGTRSRKTIGYTDTDSDPLTPGWKLSSMNGAGVKTDIEVTHSQVTDGQKEQPSYSVSVSATRSPGLDKPQPPLPLKPSNESIPEEEREDRYFSSRNPRSHTRMRSGQTYPKMFEPELGYRR